MKGNDVVTWMLRSPLHPLMGNTMLLTVSGRKTGRMITLPVNYVREGNTLLVITSRDRTWWRNLAQGGEVSVHLGGRDQRGVAELVLDEDCVAQELSEYVRRSPLSARSLGVGLTDHVPDQEDLGRVAKERLFVRICLA